METSISQDDVSRLNDKDKAELRDFIEKEAKRTKFQARMFVVLLFVPVYFPSPFLPLLVRTFESVSQSVSQSRSSFSSICKVCAMPFPGQGRYPEYLCKMSTCARPSRKGGIRYIYIYIAS